ncbi:MAG: DUF2791 family P-loop domain-containing protein [gamma proteobacterium symbiont of Taylorina sp.]|nr:DUF2791 family P-loop domain-containing protein [gamma proteobacterium symbiont of Taylorina sp.]
MENILEQLMPESQVIDSPFHLKQAIERLREGLFDPVAVRLLTAHEAQLKNSLDDVLKAAGTPQSRHLMICGDYGQGKSHSLAYIRDRALQQGFAVSRVNLDIREIPMHNFRQVYRALVNDISFPRRESDKEAEECLNSLSAAWCDWAKQQHFEQSQDVLDFLPETMPHLFRCVLSAMTQKNMSLSKKQKTLKKHVQFRPKEYPYLLNLALSGEIAPIVRLRSALKYRQIPNYTKQSLVCKGNQPYLEMIKNLGWLIQEMGYKGWVLLFDEVESISQLRIMARSQSYHLVEQLIYSQTSDSNQETKFCPAIAPVFALTDDFFDRLRAEDYERSLFRKEIEIPYFSKNYAQTLNNLTIFRLHDLAEKEWQLLIEKLIRLYCQTYHWETNQSELKTLLVEHLKNIKNKETRLKIKALINELDLEYQEALWQYQFKLN